MLEESDQVVRFDSFEVDPVRRQLLLDREPVSLTPRQFDTLLYFVRNPGRLLTKEELLKSIWPDQFVEEGNLSQNVFWVRKALARGADETTAAARYIVTLPGKGYQFNFPTTTEVALPSPVALPSEPASPAPRRWAVAVAVALMGLLALGLSWKMHRSHVASAEAFTTSQNQVVLAQFTDDTADPSLKTSLETALRIGLEQSPRLVIAPQSDIAETLQFMQVQPTVAVTPAVAEEICTRLRSNTVVAGSIASVGTQYVVGIEATDCVTHKTLSAGKATAQDKEHVLSALDGLLPELRNHLGESAPSVQKHSTSIEQATTHSLPAFKAYTSGEELREHGDSIHAIPLYQEAIALDPKFAMAYARLGACYATLSERPQSVEAYTRAYALSSDLSQPEKFYIRALYMHRAERNMFETIRVHDEWRTLYPQDIHSWTSEADALTQMGRLPDAIRIAEAGYRKAPADGMMAMAMARAYQRSGRWDDLKRVGSEANSRGILSWDIHEMLWYRAVVLGDPSGAAAERNWIKGKPEEYQAIDDEACLLLQKGQWRESLAVWSDFEAAARQQGLSGFAEIDRGHYAVWLVELGLRDQALAFLRLWPTQTPTPEYAQALAAVGRTREAEAMLNRLLETYPHDTLLNLWHKPVMEALLALNRKDDAGAIMALKALEPAKQIGMRDYAVAFLRGKAYLQLHRYPEAADQFKSIIDAPGLDPFSPFRPLALAAYAQAKSHDHDIRLSIPAYENVLQQWRGADSDLPSLVQAKSELQQTQLQTSR